MLICQNSEINVLVDLLRKDEVVAVPTDTVFGVCARYDHIQAQENLRDLKKRPETKPFQSCVQIWNKFYKFVKCVKKKNGL